MITRLSRGAGLVLAAFLVACGGGPDAPPVGALEMHCGANFCIEYPQDWSVVDSADDYVTLAHPADPERIMATVGQTGMEGIVEASGGTWPQPADEVVEAFWGLIDDGGAEVDSIQTLADGSVTSLGSFDGGRLWYRLVPLEGSAALGVEVRAPNSTWNEHAEAITQSLAAVPTGG